MKVILNHVKLYIGHIIASIAILVLQAYLNLLMPTLTADIVNVGIQQYSSKIMMETDVQVAEVLKKEQISFIYTVGVQMVLTAFLVSMCAFVNQFVSSIMGTGLSRDLRQSVFKKIESFSGGEFDKFSTTSLIRRTTGDVNNIQMLITTGIRIMFFAPIMGIGGIIMALEKAPSMSWINFTSVILIVGVILAILPNVIPKIKFTNEILDKLNLVVRENLTGLMVVRAFATQDYEKERFSETNDRFRKHNTWVNSVMGMLDPSMVLVKLLVPAVIVWVGAGKIAESELLVGDMIAYIQYSGNIMQAFMMITPIFTTVPRAMVAVHRLEEVFNTVVPIADKEDAVDISSHSCEIKYKNVSFKYPEGESYVLKNINFTIRQGKTTAIIGSTGCGKSTLINLLLRLYDLEEGNITIGGVDIKDTKVKQMRDLIGYVPQKSILFTGDIETNIMVGNTNASSDEIKQAAAIAQADQFIMRKENQYDEFISRGGNNVSGGQRQRLAIARAIAKKAAIYIFDDSFSALDYKTDLRLRRAINENLADSAILIIGQRITSIMHADQILVMNNGEIVGRGTHKELLENCKEYIEIASSQLPSTEVTA